MIKQQINTVIYLSVASVTQWVFFHFTSSSPCFIEVNSRPFTRSFSVFVRPLDLLQVDFYERKVARRVSEPRVDLFQLHDFKFGLHIAALKYRCAVMVPGRPPRGKCVINSFNVTGYSEGEDLIRQSLFFGSVFPLLRKHQWVYCVWKIFYIQPIDGSFSHAPISMISRKRR